MVSDALAGLGGGKAGSNDRDSLSRESFHQWSRSHPNRPPSSTPTLEYHVPRMSDREEEHPELPNPN